MKSLVRPIFLAGLAVGPQTVAAAEARPSAVAVANAFPDGGGYRWENGPGTPCAIEIDGVAILPKQESGTYCSGFTFAVAMRTAAERGLLVGKTAVQLRRFQKQWYGAVDEAGERQCAMAVVGLGVGVEIPRIEDAAPGDFVQLWRTNKSGHSVVLLELVRDETGRAIGLHYRSSQKSTDGIGDRTEYFSDAPGRGGAVDRRRTYTARLFAAPR